MDKDTLYTRENGVPAMNAAEREEMENYSARYTDFLGKSKTERHAYAEALRLVEAQGFRDITTFETLKPGDKIFRGYHGKTLMAAVIGSEPVAKGIRVVGGHTDAPRLDLKPVPVIELGGAAFLDTHIYGGIKKYQWVAMPLALYGVIVRKDGTIVNVEIGDKPGDPVFMISDILPHLGKDQAEKKLNEAHPAESLDVLAATVPCAPSDGEIKEKVKHGVLDILQTEYGVTEKDLVSAELEIVPAGMPRELGFDRSMILAYGHDDRVCAYAGLAALVDLPAIPAKTAMVILCDKEEVGSTGPTGMHSTFFENTVAEMISRQQTGDTMFTTRRALEASSMLSADVTAAADPHFPEVDSTGNMAILNAGPCFNKYTGGTSKGGANDARAEFIAVLRSELDADSVVWQIGELGKAEKGGGGTIADCMARFGMDVIDLGVPLLNMHAPWEAASKFDVYMTYRAYRAYLK